MTSYTFPTRRTRATGFSLVELLIVIAIIGVLIGILLPAIQKVRESSNRLKCESNLKQMGIAMHSFHDAYNSFPAGLSGSMGTLGIYCWYPLILPYVEEGTLAQSMAAQGFTPSMAGGTWLTGVGSANGPMMLSAATEPVSIFMCPSESNPKSNGNMGFNNGVGHGQGFFGNYVPCIGNGVFNFGNASTSNGIFYTHSAVTLGQITDGTSNTILASEIILTPDNPAVSRSTDYRGSYWNAESTGMVFTTQYPPNTSQGDWVWNQCWNWGPGAATNSSGTPTEVPSEYFAPCSDDNGNQPTTPSGNEVVFARSYHGNRGGVNVVMADGSVRFATNHISQSTWKALGSIAADDTIGSDW